MRSSGEQKLKDDDFIMQEQETRNKADLLLFSDKGQVYKLKIHDLPDTKASQLGDYLENVLQLDEGESIIFMHATENYEGHMIFGFENGKAAKIPVSSYAKLTEESWQTPYTNFPLAGIYFWTRY